MSKNSTTYYLPLNISLIVTIMKSTQGLRFSQQAKRQHKPSPAASGPAGDKLWFSQKAAYRRHRPSGPSVQGTW